MPFDGKGFEQQAEQDEVLALLRRARERVVRRWGRVYHERNGKVCALGAIAAETPLLPGRVLAMVEQRTEARLALYEVLPARWVKRYSDVGLAIALFNDVLWPWQKRRVLRLFDRAIARCAAGG